jgi:hypothetical protein
MNAGLESRTPRPALGCSAIDDDDEGTGAKGDPQFKFCGKFENKRRINVLIAVWYRVVCPQEQMQGVNFRLLVDLHV